MKQRDCSGFETYIRTELCLSLETISAYMRDVKEFLDFTVSQKLTAKLVEDFVSHLKQKELKNTTIRRKCMSVRCLYHHLISLNQLGPNTLDMIDSVRIERSVPSALDHSDVDKLLSTVRDRVPLSRAVNVRRDCAIILTLYHSGLRVSELCNLNIEDINFARQQMRVRGKGGRDRIVPTTFGCIEAIQTYLDSDRKSDIDAVFVKSNGYRLARRGVSDMLSSLSRKAGVKNTTAHTLRRTFATELMNNGADLKSVQTLLGHQHLSTTQNYLVIDNDRLKRIHSECHPFGEKHATRN